MGCSEDCLGGPILVWILAKWSRGDRAVIVDLLAAPSEGREAGYSIGGVSMGVVSVPVSWVSVEAEAWGKVEAIAHLSLLRHGDRLGGSRGDRSGRGGNRFLQVFQRFGFGVGDVGALMALFCVVLVC
jgi:hypothetical protein